MLRLAAVLVAPTIVVCLSSEALAQDTPRPPASDEAAPGGDQNASSAPAASPALDTRTQYPAVLANSYFSINVGYLNYAFSQAQLEPGFRAESIQIPHAAAQVVLLGHHFHKYLAAQAAYMRPLRYVGYSRINGEPSGNSVWMHFGEVTLKSQLPLGPRFSLYGEGGLSITNRSGFEIADAPAVKDTHYASWLAGGGVEYHVNRTWDLVGGATYIPGRSREKQPAALITAGGFRFNMRPVPPERVEDNRAAGYIFPEQVVRVGYAFNELGYGVNNFVSKTVPIFWGGHVEVNRGLTIRYERNVFHTRKVFGLDVGSSGGYWQSNRHHEAFYTLSLYPLLRFTLLRRRPSDVYFCYSLIGPSYISQEMIDALDTGHHFTFQDFMGVGMFLGERRRLNVELHINHYSNGNIFTENAGVKVPLTLNLGYTF